MKLVFDIAPRAQRHGFAAGERPTGRATAGSGRSPVRSVEGDHPPGPELLDPLDPLDPLPLKRTVPPSPCAQDKG